MSRLTEWGSNARDPLMGGWSSLGPATAEVLTLSGLDWVILDAQHGVFDDRSVVETLHIIPRGRTDVMVRVRRNDEALIGRSLDAGARGVIVPMIETAEDARRASEACRYPPQGGRSWGQFSTSWGRAEVSVEESNRTVVCGVMVENQRGLDNVDAIAAVPGVDMIFVGPYDLSIAFGIDIDELLGKGSAGALGTIVSACKRHDVIPGVFAGTVERAVTLANLGFVAIAAGTDAGLLRSAAENLRGAVESTRVVTALDGGAA